MENMLWTTGHEPIIPNIVSARNCELSDSDGRRYIDLESGVWCTNIGHSHPRVAETIKLQSEKIMHSGFNYYNPLIDETARKITAITGLTGGKCEFLCSGSEAVEFCVRLARFIIPEKKILVFSDSYYGAYGQATDPENTAVVRYNRLACSCNSTGTGCTGECPEFSSIPFSQIGVFLFEPGSSMGLVRFPSASLIERIAAKIKANHGLIIANEVTTGIGRTGEWFGFQHYRLKPDLIAIGKGIGNGYPVSVAVVSGEIARHHAINQFRYAQSHQNDPLGAAVAGTVIDVIQEEDLLQRARLLSELFNAGLSGLNSSNSLIHEIRIRGLMIAVELTGKVEILHHKLIDEGFIVAKRPNAEVLRIDPALTIPTNEFESFIKTLKRLTQHQ